MGTITTRVAGISFVEWYPIGIQKLQRSEGDFPLEASLLRDKDNEHDPNAIGVLCGGYQVGWLPRSLAEKLAPKIDQGERFRVIEADVLIHPDHPDRPGVEIKIEKVKEHITV